MYVGCNDRVADDSTTDVDTRIFKVIAHLEGCHLQGIRSLAVGYQYEGQSALVKLICLQSALACWSVARRTKWVRRRPWDTHREAAECGDGRVLVVCSIQRGVFVADGIDSIRIVDSDGWATFDLHCASGRVDAFDCSRTGL